jgi:hypothetical protein
METGKEPPSALLIAPQPTELGAKIGLLAGLVLLTPTRGLFDRLLRESRPDPVGAPTPGPPSPRRLFGVGAALGSALVVTVVVIVSTGAPSPTRAAAGAMSTVDVSVDASSLPPVTVSDEVAALDSDVAADPAVLATALAEALAVEGEAMLRQDTSLLRAADTGERLLAMERAVEQAATEGTLVVAGYELDELRLGVAYTEGPQGGASLVLDGSGTIEHVSYDLTGGEQARTTGPFRSSFVLSQGPGGRWLIAAVLPPDEGGT